MPLDPPPPGPPTRPTAAIRHWAEPRAGGVLATEVVGMNRSRTVAVVALVAVALLVTACAAGPNELARASGPEVAGFWQGLWHGLISPITFLISLFNHHVAIYEVRNNGGWYDFGFMIGVSIVFSGPASSRRAVSRGRRTADR